MEVDFDKTSEFLRLLDSHYYEKSSFSLVCSRGLDREQMGQGTAVTPPIDWSTHGYISVTSGPRSKGDIELTTRGNTNKEEQEYSLVRSNIYL